MKQTSNAERSTPNAQLSGDSLDVARRRLGVGPFLWRILAIAVGALFIYAGALKGWDPIGFAGDIENYHMLPWVIGAPLAVFLPWLEIACGVALIVCRAERGALAILTVLMLVFIAASVVAKARGIDISCGCFGHAARNLSFVSHLAIDFAILAAVLLLWRVASRRSHR